MCIVEFIFALLQNGLDIIACNSLAAAFAKEYGGSTLNVRGF
jgi:hypothetical protein